MELLLNIGVLGEVVQGEGDGVRGCVNASKQHVNGHDGGGAGVTAPL